MRRSAFFCQILVYTGDIEPASPENPLIPKPPSTSCDSTGLYSDPKDCSSYYICRNGEFIQMRCVANMLFDPSNGECGYIDASRCRPGQTIHIPNVFRDFNLVSGKLKESKPKVWRAVLFCRQVIKQPFANRLCAMSPTGPSIVKAKESLFLKTWINASAHISSTLSQLWIQKGSL